MFVKCDEISLEVEIIRSKEEKLKLIELMNYKFKYPIDDSLPLVRIYGFKINLP
jgi:hypothetical protein